MLADLPRHHFGQQPPLKVHPGLVSGQVRKPQLQHDRTDVAVLELDGSIGAPDQPACQTLPVERLAVALPGEFLGQHGQVVGHDEFDLIYGPVFRSLSRTCMPDHEAQGLQPRCHGGITTGKV